MTKRDWEKDWQLCERATPGPWTVAEARRSEYPFDREWVCIAGYKWDYTAKTIYVLPPSEIEVIDDALNDAEFIAEARKALPYWLQRVKELEDALRQCVEALEFCSHKELCKMTVGPYDLIDYAKHVLEVERNDVDGNEGTGSTPD